MLRGSSLKNTEYIYGISVFTGHDTKIMRNSAKAKYKFSSLEKLMNGAILIILSMQMILSATFGIMGYSWIKDHRFLVYIFQDPLNTDSSCYSSEFKIGLWSKICGQSFKLFILKMGSWILTFTNFVPISLTISVELVKFW